MKLTTDISDLLWFRILCLFTGIFLGIFGVLEFIEVAKRSENASYKFAISASFWGIASIYAALRKKRNEEA
jgi:hypothetical protein